MRGLAGQQAARIVPALFATFLIVACEGNGAGDDADDKAAAIPVEVALPVRDDILATYSGTAPVEAFADATVIARVGGEVVDILVEEGDDVVRGQLMARLDGDQLRLNLAEIKARLDKLRQDHDRNRELLARDLISEGDFDTIQFEMQALDANHDLAALELSYTEIRSPIDGVVSERFIKTGNTIDVQSPAFQVTSLEPLVSYLHVPEREYGRLKPGMTAEVAVDALPETTFLGEIARTSPTIDPATGTFKLTIEVSDDSRRLKPGMFARIGIVSDRRENALKIPRNALVETDGENFVFVVADGVVERRQVDLGYVEGAWVEVRDGLTDGEPLVVVGQTGLKDGASVTVVETASMLHATANAPTL